MPGPQEMFIILVIVLVLFGAKKLPELARGLGQGIREFKKASSDTPEPEKIDPAKTQANA
ncbi:MAG: twin-arginine translocase TatA/TatE family subunit [candidate division KSB1 bacterium]